MPPKSSLKFPVTKSSGRLAAKRKSTKEKLNDEQFDDHCDSICKENKKPKLNDNIDNSSSIDDEMQTITDALSSSTGEEFLERNDQIKTIRSHLTKCLNKKESVSLYFCGPSGTGKTAVIQFLQSQKDIQSKFTVVYVNCLDHQTNCNDVYREIQQKLGGDAKMGKTVKDNVDKLLKTLNSQKQPVLLILDKVLKLSTKNQAVLHSLLQLPSQVRNGQMVLITIGHILNFVDRFLSRMANGAFMKPFMVEFPPYSDQEIVNIIQKRLNKINLKSIKFEPAAIQLLGRKAAANCCDARNALELTKEVIKACIAKNTKDGVCTIQPIDVQILMTGILGETEKFDRLDHLPLHQKLIVCAVLMLIRDQKFDRTKLDIYKIEDMYLKICKKQKIEHCRSDEFINLCSLIECTGVFSIAGKKRDRQSKVTVEWNEDEIKSRFSDKCLFGTILSS
ncbi:cell division control protein 6 homolog [Planococcus citri]|uniref:cell division control protein 6 homolog n=1 Tax=Planococcus citri TaxID=170843 RepID=UPI0031F84015